MTREEILNKHLGVSAEYIKNTLPALQEEISDAMSEYAEQEAVAFSRWATGEPIKSELYSIYKQLTKQQ